MTLYKGPHSLYHALAPHYLLNKAEYLQLYNLRPTTQVTLELVIEEVSHAFAQTTTWRSLHRRCLETRADV